MKNTPVSRRAGREPPAGPAQRAHPPVKGWRGAPVVLTPSPRAGAAPNALQTGCTCPDQPPWHARLTPGSRPGQARPGCTPPPAPHPRQPRLFKEGRGCAALRLAGPDLLRSQQGRGHIFHAARHADRAPRVRTSCQDLHGSLGHSLRAVMSPRPGQNKYQSNAKRECTNNLNVIRHDFRGKPGSEPCMRSSGAGMGSGRAATDPFELALFWLLTRPFQRTAQTSATLNLLGLNAGQFGVNKIVGKLKEQVQRCRQRG